MTFRWSWMAATHMLQRYVDDPKVVSPGMKTLELDQDNRHLLPQWHPYINDYIEDNGWYGYKDYPLWIITLKNNTTSILGLFSIYFQRYSHNTRYNNNSSNVRYMISTILIFIIYGFKNLVLINSWKTWNIHRRNSLF